MINYTINKFHNKSTRGNPRLQASNIALSGASNKQINVLGDTSGKEPKIKKSNRR
jgi:hypothetical protein